MRLKATLEARSRGRLGLLFVKWLALVTGILALLVFSVGAIQSLGFWLGALLVIAWLASFAFSEYPDSVPDSLPGIVVVQRPDIAVIGWGIEWIVVDTDSSAFRQATREPKCRTFILLLSDSVLVEYDDDALGKVPAGLVEFKLRCCEPHDSFIKTAKHLAGNSIMDKDRLRAEFVVIAQGHVPELTDANFVFDTRSVRSEKAEVLGYDIYLVT